MAAPSTTSEPFKFLPQGAIIQEFNVAGQNIVLGFNSAEPYQTHNSPFFGETIGRVANRLTGGKIQNLNGKTYTLAVNNGPNALHGGVQGWGKKRFHGPTPDFHHGKEAIQFKYLSPDGDEGYPGSVEFTVWYTPAVEKSDGVEKTSLEIEYELELVGDEVDETAVNVTNHSYFNISGGPSIEGTKATLHTNLHQVTDEHDIPTGSIEPFPGITASKEFILGAEEPDIDHCFIMNTQPESVPLDTRSQPFKKLCEFTHPNTGLHFEVTSTEPAFQFYTGKYVDVPEIDGLPPRGARSGFCVEAARYVNAVNDDRWRGMVVLKKGQKFGSKTVWTAWKTS